MTDRPIIFSGPMVRAILEGSKTQTRRVILPRPWNSDGDCVDINIARSATLKRVGHGRLYIQFEHPRGGPLTAYFAPYSPGDRLWVRETWAHYQTVNHVWRSDGRAFDEVSDGLAGYRADGHGTIDDFRDHIRLISGCDLEHVVVKEDRWIAARDMPRWASRLTLIVDAVKVERLQDISDADVVAEGTEIPDWKLIDPVGLTRTAGSDLFRPLWDSINGARPGCTWADNPWVAAITFRTIKANIDTQEARA